MKANKQMYYVGHCRICGTGPLGLRACGNCENVIILCDECDAIWTDADLNAIPIYANQGELPCPECETSLIESPSHWATQTEIEAIDWIQQAIDEGTFELKLGSAIAPEANEEE